ncbi:Telomere end binding protein [Neofusicoccum parvum]|uniref:Telomere end binding protein n=1 Tax=Neofusicoccum parvum TaxID=310453 RepID=A0ACB5S1Z2_9PEZI|nr:Telomere end binding protein [Neofusicoccum parvum]
MPLRAPVRVPEGFVTAKDALAAPIDTVVNVIGVVADFMPLSTTSGTGIYCISTCLLTCADRPADLQFTMHIQDESIASKLGEGGKGMRVKFFVKSANDSPQIETLGDTVLLRSFKKPTAEQQMWAIALHHALCPDPAARAQPTTEAPERRPGDKFNYIKNIGPHQFFDLVVEVVKIFPLNNEIYVTDYSENNLLYRYNHPDENLDLDSGRDGDTYDYIGSVRRQEWPGPFGQMTLQVKLWEPHASHTFSKVREGEIIELKNVHIKMDSAGTKIEGALHGDRQYPTRVYVHKIAQYNRRVFDLEDRKKSYLARLKNQGQKAQGSKTRKEKRKEKKASDKRGKHSTTHTEDQASESDHDGPNIHVKCERPQDPTTRLADIESNEKRLYKAPNGVDCNLPFINATYRARVRVVDFWPEKLEDFSKSLDDPEYNDVDVEGETQSSTSYTALSMGTQRWEWHFCLLVEDAKPPPGTKGPVRIPLLVFDKDAEYLLRLDATDLRKDRKTLAQLREKLFILWGNLEELKSTDQNPLDTAVAKEHSSNMFDCCIKETGVRVDTKTPSEGPQAEFGYQRIYHLCGTTIND